jgi:hypothetical protein
MECNPNAYEFVFVRFLTESEKKSVSQFKARVTEIATELKELKDKENKLQAELICLNIEQKNMMVGIEHSNNFQSGFKVDPDSNIVYELVRK